VGSRVTPTGLDRAAALAEVAAEAARCVTCGLCNQVCPTFARTGREIDGPRGRVHFLRELAQHVDSAGLAYLDPCVRCDLCSEVCPTAVDFGAAVRVHRTAAGIAPRSRGDLAALTEQAVDSVEARYFAAQLEPVGLPNVDAGTGSHSLALVPGPLLASAGPDVVAAAQARCAPDAAVFAADPGTGLLELGLDALFAERAARFVAALRALDVRRVVCLDPWSVSAVERSLRGSGLDVAVSHWLHFLLESGHVVHDDGALLLDWGPEPLEDVGRIAPGVPDDRILPASLRAHVSLPAFAAEGRMVQCELRRRFAEFAAGRRVVTFHPITLLSYPRAELAGASVD